MTFPTSLRRALRLATTTVAVTLGAGLVASPVLAASDVVPATTMKSLVGSRFPATDIRDGLFSPDHTRILYRGREATPADVSSDQPAYRRAGDYYVMRADGSQLQKLTAVTSVPDSGVKVNAGVWSPDSRRVAFLRDASTRTERDLKTVQTATVSTNGGTDRWVSASEGEAVASLSFTPDSRYLVWEERVSSVFTIDTMGVELATGRAFRLRWRPDPAPAQDPGWTWAGECDRATALAATKPASAPRLPNSTTDDPQLDALAALIGKEPACYSPATTSANTTVPTPTPGAASPTATPTATPSATPTPTSSPTASPTPTATPAPTPTGTPTPTAAATPTPTPTPEPTDTPVTPTRANGPGAGTLTPLDPTIQPDTIARISEDLAATGVTLGGPSLTIRSVGRRLRGANPPGVKVNYAVTGARSLKAWLLLPAAKSTTKARILARLTLAKPANGRASIRLRIGVKAQRTLKAAGRRTVTIRLVATNPAGIATTVERSVTLR